MRPYVSFIVLHNIFFFFQAEDGIRDKLVTGVQTCALPIYLARFSTSSRKREASVFVRILSTAFLVSALAAVPVAAQAPQGGSKSTTTTTTSGPVVTSDEIVLEGDSSPRPALPTINGDTGLWFVPTGEVMPNGK